MQKLEKKQNENAVGANCVRTHFEVMTKNQKGITLIALIITIIVMMILVAVTVNLAINGGIFSTARQASKDTEMHAIYDQIIAAMKLTDNGRIDVAKTYEQARQVLESEEKTVAIIKPATEAEITEETTRIVFTVQGKYAKYKYEITGIEVKLIGEETGGGKPGDDDPDDIPDEPVVPQGYVTTLEGLGTGVSLVQYASLTGNLKTAADNGKITAVIEETVAENGETKTLRAVIPTGLTVSTTDGEDTISGGLVVRDESQNEFVWIPVPEINDMVMCQSAEEIPEGAPEGTNGICTLELQDDTLKCTKHNSEELAGRLYTDSNWEFNANLAGQTYNETSKYKEPANFIETYTIQPSTWTGETGGTFVYDSQDAFTRYGGGEYSDTMYQTEFNSMATSVAKYGGFYVGRYETGGYNESVVVSKKNRGITVTTSGEQINNKGDINAVTWYKMYRMQKEFKSGSIIIGSSMIWGCQYDQVMKFVDQKLDGIGEIFDVTTVGGRYKGRKLGTGGNTADLVANIYDLEGSVSEWTLERTFWNSYELFEYRVLRGMVPYEDVEASPTSERGGGRLTNIEERYGSRMSLYIR